MGLNCFTEKYVRFRNALNNKRCISLVNKTTLFDLLELFNVCDAFITNDSGLAHLSSLSPIKRFIMFGPETPKVYSPLGNNKWEIYAQLPCSPCFSAFNHRKSCCENNYCLKTIKVEEVYQLIKKEL